jgi:hypothetical protein
MKRLSVAFGAKRHVRARCRLVPFADDPEAGILLRRRGEPPPLDLMNNLTMLHTSTCSARGKHVHFDTPNGASKGQAPDSARTDGCCFRWATCRDGKQSRRFWHYRRRVRRRDLAGAGIGCRRGCTGRRGFYNLEHGQTSPIARLGARASACCSHAFIR